MKFLSLKTLNGLLPILVLTYSLSASAKLVFEGILTNSSGVAIANQSGVSIRATITGPSNPTCILYKEVFSSLTTGSDGYAKVVLGTGSNAASALTLDRVFENQAGNMIGAASCVYAPAAGEIRTMKIEVDAGTGYEDLGSIDITPAPFATTAENVSGYSAGQLLRVASGSTAPVLSSSNITELTNLIAGTSTTYAKNGSSGGMVIGSYSGTPAGAATGQIWYDNGFKFWDGSQTLPLGGIPSTLPNVTNINNSSGGISLTPGTAQSVTVSSSTTSTTPTSGALLVSGGAGITGDVNISGSLSAPMVRAAQYYGGSGPVKIDASASGGNIILGSAGSGTGAVVVSATGNPHSGAALYVAKPATDTNLVVGVGSASAIPSIYLTSSSTDSYAGAYMTYNPSTTTFAIGPKTSGSAALGIQGGVPWLSFDNVNNKFTFSNPASTTPPMIGMLNYNGNALVTNGTDLGKIAFNGMRGAGNISPGAAYIRSYAEGTWSSSNNPTSIAFATTPSGSSTAQDRMTITNSGNVGIGTANPSGKLEVKGSLVLSGSTTGSTTIQAPSSGSSINWTLPSSPGSSGQVLTTDGTGVLSWNYPQTGPASGVCTTSSAAPTTSGYQTSCSGSPTMPVTAVVSCSPASSPGTITWSAMAGSTAGTVKLFSSGTATATTWKCMWMD